ncbi:outer membrane beta-barrel protein [Paraflavisolibacter sp. H34]|uniref:outer membrane beta-barrel protein n=1 Tax=Huijunlia imazamoxiresistens TaxID=3127457 RepID=UPI0030174805
MRKKILLLGLAFLAAGTCTLKAQTFTLSGKLQQQEASRPVQGATALLQSATDTTLRLHTVSDSSGFFRFTGLRRDSFLLRISSIGYENLSRGVRIDSTDKDLGTLVLPKTSKELTGVTVTVTVPPATQKGDTVQYNASQFKVNPDASAEDLARKLPGVTIEDGQVKAQGENVQKVTIDGRELFGDDATAALRNLPAEIIDKIQVFDRLSDQAQLTGFDDGNTQKGINIVTKANMRNGQFGRVYAGYGTDGRYQAGGNATILKDNRRLSLVGLANNINQQNFSSQDLLGVTSNAQRGGNRGGNRGGGGGGGNRGGNRGGGGNSGGFGNNGNFLVGQQNGINRTNSAGINYSDLWGKKVTVSGSYFFNNNDNTTNETVNRQYFLQNVANLNEATRSGSKNNNHRFNMRFEYKIDSSNQLLIMPSLSFQNNSTDRHNTTLSFFDTTQKVSETRNTSNSDRKGNNLNNTILYRHSFAKRGRSFSINLNTSYNQRTGETFLDAFNRRYNTDGSYYDSLSQQYTDQANSGYQLSTNIGYTEPVGKKGQLQLSYNPSYSRSQADQQTFQFNPADAKYSIFRDSLSSRFNNTFKAQNAGLSFRRGDRDNQISFGLNYQHSSLNSDQQYPRQLTVSKTFDNLLPNAQLRLKFSDRSSFRFFYRANTSQPSVTQLQDVADISHPPYISMGNPELEQQYMHTLSTRYTFTNTAKGLLLVGNVYYQAARNYITNATYIADSDSTIGKGITLLRGQQLTKPVNVDGYSSFRSFLTFAVPLKTIKSNFNLNGGFTYGKQPGIINYLKNESQNYTYTLGSVLASNISQYVDFTVSYSANFSQVKNEVQPAQNNNYFSHVGGVQLNLLSKNGWFFQNDLNNQLYRGLSLGFNQSYWLWNMSAGKKFFKNQKGELRLSVFDLLRQNQSISRNVTDAYIEDVQNEVLRQYFMLTFSYNLRNFGSGKPAGLQQK